MHYREVKFGMLIFYTATDGLDAGRARCRGRVPTGESALAYSLVYNITYLGPDCVVCALISLIPGFDRLTESLRKRT